MSEDEVREGLRVAVLDEPPFAFDADAVIFTAEQQARRRRALVSVGVATAAIAVAAVAVPVGLGIAKGGEGFGVGARPTGSATLPVLETYTAEELRQRGREMEVELRTRMPVVVPGIEGLEIGQFGGEAAGQVSDGQDYLNSFATFTLAGQRYGIGINVYAPGAHPEGPTEICAAAPAQCQQLGQQDGGTLVAKSEVGQQDRIQSVYHFRDDGSVVSAVGYNYDPTSPAEPKYLPTIPVTVDQLAALAVDKKLGL